MNILSERLDATNNASFRDLTQKNHALQKACDAPQGHQARLIEKERIKSKNSRSQTLDPDQSSSA